MVDFEKMSKEALSDKLEELKDLLDEVKEERDMILGQENLHLSHTLVEKYANEIAEIEQDIATVENLLKNK